MTNCSVLGRHFRVMNWVDSQRKYREYYLGEQRPPSDPHTIIQVAASLRSPHHLDPFRIPSGAQQVVVEPYISTNERVSRRVLLETERASLHGTLTRCCNLYHQTVPWCYHGGGQ